MSTWAEPLPVRAMNGDVDADGQIVDRVVLDRLRAAIGTHRSVEVDRESQLEMTLTLLRRAKAART